MDTDIQVGIVTNYRAGQDLDLRISPTFNELMERAIAQAAIGTLKTKPQSVDFTDLKGSPILPQSIVWVEVQDGRLKARVQRLDHETGKVKIRMMSHPPDVMEVSPKILEVIHDKQRDEHPED